MVVGRPTGLQDLVFEGPDGAPVIRFDGLQFSRLGGVPHFAEGLLVRFNCR
jgi:hypothetical protein